MFLFYRHQLGSVPYLLVVAPLVVEYDIPDIPSWYFTTKLF